MIEGTRSGHEAPLSDRKPVVVASAGYRFVLSPGTPSLTSGHAPPQNWDDFAVKSHERGTGSIPVRVVGDQESTRPAELCSRPCQP